MGEKEDREKAEKLAAAKKRVAQLQKKKKAAASGAGEKSHTKGKPSKDDTPKSPVKGSTETAENEKEGAETEAKPEDAIEDSKALQPDEEPDADEAAFNEAIQSAGQQEEDGQEEEPTDQVSDAITPSKSSHPGRQPSMSLQSKLRSTSFRDTAPGPVSPNVGSLSRIEELERENRRLEDEASDYESRWRKTEEDLEELREETANNNTSEIARLRAEIDLLKRQQKQGSASSTVGGGKSARRESIVSSSRSPDESDSLRKEVESKDSTIADMQLEISRLRSQLSSQTSSCDEHGSQISSLTTSLSTTGTKLRSIETELADTKKSLARASEKAVLEGTERTSKDTKIRTLERDLEAASGRRDEVVKKAEQLEKKVEAMSKLHRESEARSSSKLSAAEQISREIPALRAKVSTLEAENARLREKHKRAMSGGGADEGLDELEDEERNKLSRRIRELESQVFELQRGVWRDKRTALQPDIDSGAPSRKSLEGGEDFDEVDLFGGASSHASRRASSNLLQRTMSPGSQQKHSNFTQYISSGLNAFMPSATSPPPGGTRPRNDSLLQDFDDEAGFDEAAFAQAQREEEARKMLEHVREVKRGLKNWKGWRLDLVDARRGEGGWEIFEV